MFFKCILNRFYFFLNIFFCSLPNEELVTELVTVTQNWSHLCYFTLYALSSCLEECSLLLLTFHNIHVIFLLSHDMKE